MDLSEGYSANAQFLEKLERAWKLFVTKFDNMSVSTSCWTWTAGYAGKKPKFRFDGKMVHAARFSYEYHNGVRVPKGYEVARKCQNFRCVNPAHVYLRTPDQAVALSKFKIHRGPKQAEPKLSIQRPDLVDQYLSDFNLPFLMG